MMWDLKLEKEFIAIFTENSVEDEILFTGDNDEIVPNCEGKPCNFAYREGFID